MLLEGTALYTGRLPAPGEEFGLHLFIIVVFHTVSLESEIRSKTTQGSRLTNGNKCTRASGWTGRGGCSWS